MKKLNILLIEGNARQVLPFAKALKEMGHFVATYNTSRFDFGYASKYPDRKILSYADPHNEAATLEAVVKEISENSYDLIIPMNDDIAILLSKHKPEIETYAKVAVNDWDVFKMSMDKLTTMQVCMANSIPCPLTVGDIDEFKTHSETIGFPVVVKPRVGCGAVGFHVSHDTDNLRQYFAGAVKKYGPCLIQEYIPQTDLQYKAELYIDRNGCLKSAVVFAKVRWYPIDGGSSTLNMTVDRPDIVDSCMALLRQIGWRGYADVDLIQDPRDGVAKIMEINPRITGSVKICFKAGVNFARQIIEDFSEEEVTPMFEYKKPVYLRYFQKDILWFLKSKNRLSAKPSWFDFRNTVDQIFSWSDPMPFLSSSLEGFSKLRKDSKKRQL